MSEDAIADNEAEYRAWTLDQVTKSEFFHQKLHEWGLITVAEEIECIQGETLTWDRNTLGITELAWDKIIHRGIKPILVFAHPIVLGSIARSVSYYRMLAMVSQKSMTRIGLSVNRYETATSVPDTDAARELCRHLNGVVSRLVELDEKINAREFDLWRGMAAGTQAQGSWGNIKGDRPEIVIKGLLQRRLRESGLVRKESSRGSTLELIDGRIVRLSAEPDVGIYQDERITAAIEIKGGIDAAGVLERIGAAVKSLGRAREENPEATTILILQGVSITETALKDLDIHRETIHHWITVEDIVESEASRRQLFALLGI